MLYINVKFARTYFTKWPCRFFYINEKIPWIYTLQSDLICDLDQHFLDPLQHCTTDALSTLSSRRSHRHVSAAAAPLPWSPSSSVALSAEIRDYFRQRWERERESDARLCDRGREGCVRGVSSPSVIEDENTSMYCISRRCEDREVVLAEIALWIEGEREGCVRGVIVRLVRRWDWLGIMFKVIIFSISLYLCCVQELVIVTLRNREIVVKRTY